MMSAVRCGILNSDWRAELIAELVCILCSDTPTPTPAAYTTQVCNSYFLSLYCLLRHFLDCTQLPITACWLKRPT